MEPPGEGRYERPGVLARLAAIEAAMEPPGEGRYEAPETAPESPQTDAAMEPPGEGRYEVGSAEVAKLGAPGRNGAAR